jgi:hypothetical protein
MEIIKTRNFELKWLFLSRQNSNSGMISAKYRLSTQASTCSKTLSLLYILVEKLELHVSVKISKTLHFT